MKRLLLLAILPWLLAATTRPATQPNLPPGFEQYAAGGRSVACEKQDWPWIEQTLANLPPATRPATMPTDLLARLAEQRQSLIDGLVRDLALNDPSVVAAFVDGTLRSRLDKLAELRPPVIYLVASADTLRQRARAGWEDARFHYNRAMDEVTYRGTLALSLEREMEPALLPAIYQAGDTEDTRVSRLRKTVAANENMLARSIAERGQFLVQAELIEWIEATAMAPLKLPAGGQWLGLGISAVVGTRHAAAIIGGPEAELLEAMVREPPRWPVKAAGIDLLHPIDRAVLRDEVAPLYAAAFRRKSTRVVRDWLNRAGSDAVPKIIAAIRKSSPADGEALLKTIAQQTGQDLTGQVGSDEARTTRRK